MRTRTWLTGLGAGSLLVAGVIAANQPVTAAQQGGTPAGQSAGGETETNAPAIVGTPLLRPTIDLTRAQEVALQGQTGAAVTAVDLDGDDGVLVYEVELDNGSEVEVDATSGVVVKTEPTDEGENGDDNGENDDEDENGGDEDGGAEEGENDQE